MSDNSSFLLDIIQFLHSDLTLDNILLSEVRKFRKYLVRQIFIPTPVILFDVGIFRTYLALEYSALDIRSFPTTRFDLRKFAQSDTRDTNTRRFNLESICVLVYNIFLLS